MEFADDLDAQSQSVYSTHFSLFTEPTTKHIVFGLISLFFFIYMILVVAIPASSYHSLIKKVGSENVYEIPGSMQACHWCFLIVVLVLCGVGYVWGDVNVFILMCTFAISLGGTILIWITYGIYFAKTDLFKLGQNPMSLTNYSQRINALKKSPKAQHKWTASASIKRRTQHYVNGRRVTRTTTDYYTCTPFIFQATQSTDCTEINLDALFDRPLINIDLQYKFDWQDKLSHEDITYIRAEYKALWLKWFYGDPDLEIWDGNTMEKNPGNALITKTGSLPRSIGSTSRIFYAIFWGGLGYCYKLASMVTKKVAYIEKTITATETGFQDTFIAFRETASCERY